MKSLLLCSLLLAGFIYAQPKPGEGSIEGHVYNAITGVPVRKATVTLMTSQMWLTAETDVEGGFRFTGLPAGSYRPTATQAGYLERAARRSIVLTDGQHAQKVDIQLVPQAVISGHVVDEDGDPVGGARVDLYQWYYSQDEPQRWGAMNVMTTTNEAGEYRIANLSSGRYLIRVQDPRGAINNKFGERPQMLTTAVYYPNATTEETAAPVEATAGKESRGIDIRLFRIPQPRLFHVRGRVVGAPQGTQVFVTRGAPAGPPDYAFDVEVPAGQQSLSANTPMEPFAFARSTVNVSSDMKDVILTLNPAPVVTGRVRVAEQDAAVDLKGVWVTLQPTHSFRAQAISEANGKLDFGSLIVPGRHVVVVDAKSLPKGCFVQKIVVGGREVTADGLDIQSSMDIEVVLSSKAATIAGSVADEDGTQFGGSAVTLISADGRIVKQTADEQGNFTLKNVRPGKYKLLAWDNVEEFVWQEPESRNKYEGKALDVSIGPSETQSVKVGAVTPEEMK